jgi:hypothetical protein
LKSAPKRPVGRPKKAPGERKRRILTLRARDALHKAISIAASQNERSLSEEIEARIERSFDRQDLLTEGLDLAFGESIGGLLVVLGAAMQNASRRAGYRIGEGRDPMLNPDVREQSFVAVDTILGWLRGQPFPDGRGLGITIAAGLIDWLETYEPSTARSSRAFNEAAKRLAPLLPQRSAP